MTMATGALAGLAAGDEGIQKLLLDPKCTAIESFIADFRSLVVDEEEGVQDFVEVRERASVLRTLCRLSVRRVAEAIRSSAPELYPYVSEVLESSQRFIGRGSKRAAIVD